MQIIIVTEYMFGMFDKTFSASIIRRRKSAKEYVMRDGTVPSDDRKLRIALGSTSALKIKAVTMAFEHFGQAVEVIPIKAESGVANQPEGFDQMLDGARARARSALNSSSEIDVGIGLESGIVHIASLGVKDGEFCVDHFYFDPAIAVVMNRDGNECVGFGPGFPIPKWAVEEARKSELGDVVMKRGAKDKNPMAYFSDGTIDRTEILSSAVKMALAQYLFPHRYKA